MPKNLPINVTNRLLTALPREEYERLLPHLETVSLDLKKIIYQPNEPIEYVYFPNSGLISMVALMEDGAVVEVGTVGSEGMAGVPIVLGSDQIPTQAIVQIAGDGLRMKVAVFKREVLSGGPFHILLQRYTQALFNLVAQSVACNSQHSIEQRCCRWLLMSQDRVGSDQFLLTQEFFAQMLGVRRASVSVVAAILQKAGFISYTRGKMKILDREGLESGSCECYAVVKREFERLLGDNSGQ